MKTTNIRIGVLSLLILLTCVGCIKEPFAERDFILAVTDRADVDPDQFDAVRLFGRIEGLNRGIANTDLPREYGFLMSEAAADFVLTTDGISIFRFTDFFDRNLPFETRITGLSLTTTYFFRAYVKLGARTHYGEIKSFDLSDNFRIALTGDTLVNDIATLTGVLLLNFRAGIEDHGIVYAPASETAGPVLGRHPHVSLESTSNNGIFEVSTSPLDLNTAYLVRPYAKVGESVVYGDEIRTIHTRDGWKRFALLDDFLIRDPIGVAVGDNAYVGMGCDFDNCTVERAVTAFNRIWEFDPSRDRGRYDLAEKKRGPSGRLGAVSFQIGGKFYFGLGGIRVGSSDLLFSDLWEFDPAGNGEWIPKDDFPGNPRKEAVAFAFESSRTAYVGTGTNGAQRDGTEEYGDFWRFDPDAPSGQQWTSVDAPLPVHFDGASFRAGRSRAVALTIGETAYVGSGATSGLELSDWWAFDPAQPDDPWTFVSNGQFANRQEAVAFTIETDGKAYVGMGNDDNAGAAFLDLWEFDPAAADPWIQRQPFPMDSLDIRFAFSIGGKGYVGGPNEAHISIDIWEYTPAVK